MKRFYFFGLIIICLVACNHEDKALKEIIVNADSVAINYFTGDGKADSVTDVKIIRDKQVIEQLAEQITERKAEFKSHCGYDGSIHFFKNDRVVQDIKFRMQSTDCEQFSFNKDGKQAATVLSPEADRLLKNLRLKAR